MQHREAGTGGGHLVAFPEPSIGRDVAGPQEPHGETLGGQAVEQELVGHVRALDWNAAEPLLQFGGAGSVVDVPVGQQDLAHLDPGLLDADLDLVEVAAGIGHGALLRCLVPQQRAVLLERRDRDDGGFERHGCDGPGG